MPGVWFRDEVTGIGFSYSWGFLPGIDKALTGCFPPQNLDVFGKVEGTNEDQHLRLETTDLNFCGYFIK